MPVEESEEVMLFWEDRSPHTGTVEQYERYLDVVARRITIASNIVIEHFWKSTIKLDTTYNLASIFVFYGSCHITFTQSLVCYERI